MSKNLKTLSFHLNSCENSINETDEHIEQENMKEHMNNLLQTLSQNKGKFQQLAQNQRNQVLEQKKYNNHLRSQYYNKDLVNRKQFKREIKSVSLFDEKQKFAHLPVSGIIGHRERFQSIQPERAKNPTTLVTDTNCRYFGQMPEKKLTQQQIDRIEFWNNKQETQKMYQYEELIINQTGSYKKDRLDKAIKVRPFIPPDQNELNSIEKLETQMYALGKTSKNHFDQQTKQKIILQQSFDPYSTCDRFTIRHNLTDKKQMNTFQTLGDENSPQNQSQNFTQNQNLNLSPVQIYLPTIEQSEKQKENFKKLQQFLQVENNWKPNQTKTENSFLNTIKLEQQKQENSPDPKIRICKKNQEQKLEVTLSNNNIKIYDF
ncbi:hypothetical protein PPERSA_10370 [Pseudocohnilembus persalinus]|uniref:Uncharacterized protein n=1 Tax=Pseudocohnilembus persalinus TaxID=266149 RepID=A0A0V0QN62_PSEPJ|nr:hypothetical protein PPERSA_10370 [Pseudocohnilembus persalinus]|eukprot:KRX03686.1 hypothetical protein PPERSA_10370 [Pseudocohnilembus persalinus]